MEDRININGIWYVREVLNENLGLDYKITVMGTSGDELNPILEYTGGDSLALCIENHKRKGHSIESITRLSDGEIFNVDDDVIFSEVLRDKIKKIEVVSYNVLKITFYDSGYTVWSVGRLTKIKKDKNGKLRK